MWPFNTRHLRAELDAVKADRERIRGERNQFKQDRDTARYNREQALRQLADAAANNRRVQERNLELGRRISALAESDPEYAAHLERQMAEVLEEHDVHRKALADALGDQKRHLNWEQLIGEAGRLAGSAIEQLAGHVKEKARADELQAQLDDAARELAAVRKVEESLARQIHEMAQPVEPSDEEVDAAQLRLELDAERRRADHLQKELDDACGMPTGGILNSAPWQPGYKAVSP